MLIRLAQSQDLPAIMALFHHLSPNYQDNPEAIKKSLAHGATEVFVLEENGVVVGTATNSYRAVPSAGEAAYLDDMVVDPSQRGKGFGEELCRHCIQAARQKGCIRIELTTHTDRVAANKLYQKMGFKLRDTNCYVLKF
ncbi:GNAT family N-acetyltransferase [Candidatus Uhrbacteria bacterium]|nr:GNAT family N-acetyltransferase [Candidatus Uhrbacteria bacterium]